MNKTKMNKPVVKRTSRRDAILHLRQSYSGTLDTPVAYNRAFAAVLRHMATELEKIDNAWVDPQVVVWMHEEGEITAEVPLSPPARSSRKRT